MISLPTRTDKRDTFALRAALLSIKCTQIDGVGPCQGPAPRELNPAIVSQMSTFQLGLREYVKG